MSQMIKIRTDALTGRALEWAIETIEGCQPACTGQLQLFANKISASVDELIDKYAVWVDRGSQSTWLADTTRDPCNRQPGDTREEAVQRAVVFAKHGAVLSVPANLARA